MRKVRIGATVRGAFDLTLNLRVLVGCAGGWSILLLAAILIGWAVDLQRLWFGELGNTAVTLMASAGMAVNVHRRVLLGESPSLLRLGRNEMMFVWREIVMIGFCGVVGFFLILVYVLSSDLLAFGVTGRVLVGVACACLALLLVIEFIGSVLVLPAAAIGDASFRWSGAWEAAEGNKLAILLVLLTCAVPLSLLSLALDRIDSWLAAWSGTAFVTEVLRCVMAIAQSILDAGALSLVFSGLVDGNPDFAVISTDGSGDT